MADTFVKMVEFRSTGLEQIELGLKKAVVTSESAITAGKAYQKVLDSTVRTLPSMTRIFEAGVRVQKENARALGEVARAQDRVNASASKSAAASGLRYSFGQRGGGVSESGAVGRMIAAGVDKFQRAITATVRSFGDVVRGFRGMEPSRTVAGGPSAAHRFGGGLGAAAGVAGTAGAAVAGGGLALGVSGLSGTVPMARFNNQMERFTWELGNTLTPFVDILTKKLGQANNWLARQPESTQNAVGTGLAVGGTAAAAQVASRTLFGVGLGGMAASVGGGLLGLGRSALFGAQAAAPTAAQSMYAAAYGSRGLPAAEATGGWLSRGLGALGSRAGMLSGPVAVAGIGITAGMTSLRQNYLNAEAQEAAKGKTDASHLQEYDRKFSGLSGDDLKKAVDAERMRLTKEDISKSKDNNIGFFGALWRSVMPGSTNVRGMADVNENEMRRNALAQVAGERPRPRPDHKVNAMVGGDFGEIGSGYYAAASELGKTGYDAKAAGGGGGLGIIENMMRELLDAVKLAAEKQANPLK